MGGESHGKFSLLSPHRRPQGSLCHQLQLARRCLGRFCAILQPRPSAEGERCWRKGCPRGHRAGGAPGTGTGMGMGTASQSRAPAGESPKGCGTPGDPPEQPAAPQLPPSPSCPFSCPWLTRRRLRQIFLVAHPRLPEAFGRNPKGVISAASLTERYSLLFL